jgi:hypothetical protein
MDGAALNPDHHHRNLHFGNELSNANQNGHLSLLLVKKNSPRTQSHPHLSVRNQDIRGLNSSATPAWLDRIQAPVPITRWNGELCLAWFPIKMKHAENAA